MYQCSDGFMCASKRLMEQREARLLSINPDTNKPYTEVELRRLMKKKRRDDIYNHKVNNGN
jgi:hypothetical protein